MSNLLAQDIAVGWRVKEEGGIGLTKAKLCTNATKGETRSTIFVVLATTFTAPPSHTCLTRKGPLYPGNLAVKKV